MDITPLIPFIYCVIFAYGLIFGSFFNVCILRIPKGISIVHPPSRCPKCKTGIPWYLNIPVFSWLYLRGKCAGCKTPISPIYPFVELLTGVVAVLVFRHFESPNLSEWIIKSLIYFLFSGSLIIISFIDIKYLIIPDRFTKGGMLVGVLLSTLYPQMHHYMTSEEGFVFSAMSGFICFFSLNAVRILGTWAYKREAMGYGDIKLVGAFGTFIGWKLGFLSIFFGAVFGSIVGIASILFSHLKLRSEIPFGPYLAVGAFCSLLWGQQFITWYLNTLYFS